MSTIHKGGAAFPFVSHGAVQDHQFIDPGMGLRDYMAIHATEEDVRRQGEVMRSAQIVGGGIGILEDGWQIKARYMHADAMLKAREAA